MARRHKTAHRKALEAHNKRQAKLRAEVVAELQDSGTLKPYAVQPDLHPSRKPK